MLEFIQKKCGLMEYPFFNDMRDTGNTVAGTIPFALEKVLTSNQGRKLSRVMLAGFGVGLSWAGCMVDMGHLIEKVGR